MTADPPGDLTRFQLDVAQMFFSLPASAGFLLAGGGALAAQHLTTRPTRDLDFFTGPGRGDVPAARLCTAQRFDQSRLLAWAAEVDAGFSTAVFADMTGALSRFGDDELPVGPDEVGPLRDFFTVWAADLRTLDP